MPKVVITDPAKLSSLTIPSKTRGSLLLKPNTRYSIESSSEVWISVNDKVDVLEHCSFAKLNPGQPITIETTATQFMLSCKGIVGNLSLGEIESKTAIQKTVTDTRTGAIKTVETFEWATKEIGGISNVE